MINNPATGAAATNGNYTGDDTVNRGIPHGLGKVPKLVRLLYQATPYTMIKAGEIAGPSMYAVTAWDATNFYVGNASGYHNSANGTGIPYYWVAIG